MKRLFKIVKKALLGLILVTSSAVGMDLGARRLLNERTSLSENYIETAQTIFGNTIDYSKVRISFGKVSCLQPDKAIALGNTIYYPASEAPAPNASFLHEMTHIWQQQNHIKGSGLSGVIKLWEKYPSYKDAYNYTADSTKALTDYNLEQQGNIVAVYFLLKHDQGNDPKHPPSPSCEGLLKIIRKSIPQLGGP
jgi:hypothetical protein